MKYGIKANLNTKSVSESLGNEKLLSAQKGAQNEKTVARNAKSSQTISEIETQEEFKEN